MQTNRAVRLRFVYGLGIAILFGTFGAGTLQAQRPRREFSVVGINQNQFARLGVTCSAQVIHGYPPGPCRGVASFVDLRGGAIKQSRYDLQPGESGFLDITPRDLNFGDGNRAEFRPVITPDSGHDLPGVQIINGETSGPCRTSHRAPPVT